MAESFRYAAPIANAYGVSVERLSALIGTLGNAGIQGSMAGTQLAFGFQKAARVFKELGMDGTGKDMVDALLLFFQTFCLDSQNFLSLNLLNTFCHFFLFERLWELNVTFPP